MAEQTQTSEPTADQPGTPPADPAAPTQPPAGSAPPADAPKPDAGSPPSEQPSVPESLDALTAPPGLVIEPATLDAFKGVARELGISPAQAKGLLDFYGRQAEGAATAARDAANAAWAELQDRWESTLEDDPAFAVPGIKQIRSEAKAQVMKGLAAVLSPEEVKLVQETPFLGSHPVLWKLAHRLGGLVAEDTMAGTAANGKAPSEADILRRMYPNSPSMFGG